jgi:hypothetical protein
MCWYAALAIVPSRARVPRGLRSPRITSQLPISSKKPITPTLQGKHRHQQHLLGGGGAKVD